MTSPSEVVLITGSSSGIGAATAYRFAKANYRIVITYRGDKSAGEYVLKTCLEKGAPEVLLAHLDVTNDESIGKLIEQITKKFTKVDVLINNAGRLVAKPISEIKPEEIDAVIRTNLTGLIKLTRACLPFLNRSLINIGSTAGLQGFKDHTIYAATKFGVRGFSQSIAAERPDLLVYAVNPGLTATKMTDWRGIKPERVSEIIFRAATGEYRSPSGSDINVNDYLHGNRSARLILLARKIRRAIREFLTT